MAGKVAPQNTENHAESSKSHLVRCLRPPRVPGHGKGHGPRVIPNGGNGWFLSGAMKMLKMLTYEGDFNLI